MRRRSRSAPTVGGWRIIRTLGKGIIEIEPRQGTAAQGSAAAVILASSQLGFALSTTHVATGSILGTRPRQARARTVRWRRRRPDGRGLVHHAADGRARRCRSPGVGDLVGGGCAGRPRDGRDPAGRSSGLMYAPVAPSPDHADNVNDDWEDPARSSSRPSPSRPEEVSDVLVVPPGRLEGPALQPGARRRSPGRLRARYPRGRRWGRPGADGAGERPDPRRQPDRTRPRRDRASSS